MKTFTKTLILLVVLTIITGCNTAKTETTPPVLTPENILPQESAYPVGLETGINSTYPVDEPQLIGTPAYLLPGFITATPDASVLSIIISEVRHDNGLESIYITNISPDVQDISAYMIYSPALDVRKILPNNLILEEGESFILYNGKDTSNFPEEQRWLDTAILTQVLDEVWLTNSAARIIYYFIYYPSITP